MATVESPVSEMLVIVKSREAQRAMLAEARGDRAEAAKHFLATAHMELVLADDYAVAGNERLAFRSRRSAASAFWRAGQVETARSQFAAMLKDYPDRVPCIEEMVSELEQMDQPPPGSDSPPSTTTEGTL
jgi:hypothetical protein